MVHHCSDEKDCKVAPQHAGVGAVDTDDFWKLMAIGRALYEARDFEAAKLNFHKAVDIVHDSQIPGHSRTKAVNNLSACLLQLGDHNGVLQCAQDVLKSDPVNVKALYRQWLAHGHLGNTHDAVQTLSALDRLSLSDEMRRKVDAHKEQVAVDEESKERQEKCDQLRKKGNECLLAGRKDQAIELYTAALKEQPLDVAASNNRAQAYLYLGRFEEAEKDATVALQSDPGNIKAIYRRGRARLGLPQPDVEGGCADLARVLSENPGNKEANDVLARAVEGMDLDGADVPEEENQSAQSPAHEGRVGSTDGTVAGNGVPTGADVVAQEVSDEEYLSPVDLLSSLPDSLPLVA